MSTQTPIFYSADAVRRVLNWPMVNEAIEAALTAVVNVDGTNDVQSNNQKSQNSNKSYVNQPTRTITAANNDFSQLLLTMPAFVGNYKLPGTDSKSRKTSTVKHCTLACKLVTSFRGNRQLEPPLPSIAANILLFSSKTGELEAIMAGSDITTWRTVSASLIATKYLYFRRFGPHAEKQLIIHVAIIGCGTQGQLHAAAMCANYKVKQLCLYNRTQSVAIELANELRSNQNNSNTEIKVCSTAGEAVQDADVICVATYAAEALICLNDLREKRSLHINAVGAGEVHFGEVSTDIYKESVVYVDCMNNANAELCGLPASIAGEVGSVIINGTYPAKQAVTIFQSMGMASEDACVAEAVRDAFVSSDN